MTNKVITFDPLAASEAFMLADLEKSGLVPSDFVAAPEPQRPYEGVPAYRLPYPYSPSGYYRDRHQRERAKYKGPARTTPELFWTVPPEVFAKSPVVAIVEGEKKAQQFNKRTGIPAVGLPGCSSWTERGPLEDGAAGEGPRRLHTQLRAALTTAKVVIVAMDGDFATNEDVGKELGTLHIELKRLGIPDLRLLDLRKYGGFDDYFVQTFSTDRTKWPTQDEAKVAVFKLARIDPRELATRWKYMLQSQELFDSGHEDFSDRGRATTWLRLMGAENVLWLTDMKKWATYTEGRWVLHPVPPLEAVNSLTLDYIRKALGITSAIGTRPKEFTKSKKDSLTADQLKLMAQFEEADLYTAQAKLSSSNASREAVLKDIAGRLRQQAKLSSFDADPSVLATADGQVVSLLEGSVREEVQVDRILRRAAARYAAAEPTGAGAQRMKLFIKEITSAAHDVRDPEAELHLLARLGVALRGRNVLQTLEILIGRGANGKSDLAGHVQSVLGDYAVQVPAATLMTQYGSRGNAEGPSPFLMKMIGARVVFASESEATDHLNAAKVKMLTGGDRIPARAMYGDAGEYDATFTPFLLTNTEPTIDESGEAIWRRISMLEFRCKWRLENEEPDPTLPDADPKLKDYLSNNESARDWLLWAMIQASARYEKHGLPSMPASVRARRAKYRENQDVMGNWLSGSVFKLDHDSRVDASEVYLAFKVAQEADGVKPISRKLFTLKLTERFPEISVERPGGKSHYVGLKDNREGVNGRATKAAA